jgi:PKD repeat protein
MNKKILFPVAALALSFFAVAQESDGCITNKAMNDYFNQHPEARKAYEQREAILSQQDAEAAKTGYKDLCYKSGNESERYGQNTTQATIYYIPVVFHILHQGGAENITDNQVIQCVNEMTTRYRKRNADTSQTISQFKNIAADISIEFRLATIDPNGNCTNGIVRHYDAHTVWLQGNFSWYTYTWNPTKYLNVYVVKSINGTAAAYTYLPGTFSSGSSADVIVARYDYVGSTGASQASHGFCISHEAGHWLNLQHTWGNTNNPGVACGDDGVTDTPITEGSNLVCNLNLQQCTSGVIENVQNYMDYSYCSTMFTAGQATRMRNVVINNTGNVGRTNVVSAANLTATGVTSPQICVPVANFHASARIVCPNATITFSDSSANAHVTQWQWNFPGGTMMNGTTVNDSMPKVSYAAPGTYAVSYTASTSAGSNSISKTGYITVNTNIATYNTAFIEGFETATLPGSDWSVGHSGSGVDFAVTSAAAATGTKSAWIDNFSNGAGNVSNLISTSFDISSFTSPAFSFKAAYQQQNSTDADKLQIYTSTDCGNNWQIRLTKSGATLATVTPPSGTPLVPGPSQFATYTVNINGVSGSHNVRFKFAFTADPNGQGNNLYIDDINIFDAAVGIASIETQFGIDIYPNPSGGKVNIDFVLSESHSIAVTVTDLLGRTIESIPAKTYAAGELNLRVAEKQPYQPGVYLVHVSVDGKMLTKKVIIQ